MAVVNTAGVEAHVANMNKRVRKPVPEFIRRNPPIHIYNISEFKQKRGLGGMGTKFIPACQPGQPYSEPLVIEGTVIDEYDEGNGRGNMSWNAEDGWEVAKDVVGINSYSPKLSTGTTNYEWWGVFATRTNKEGRDRCAKCQRKDAKTCAHPNEEQLAGAHEKFTQLMKAFLAEGDKYAASGKTDKIETMHRKAADYLKQQRNWSKAIQQFQECPGCGDEIKLGVAKCKSCGAILDRQKAIELGLITEAK